MKRNLWITLCLPLLLCGCNDWLDVKSNTNIIEKDIFSENSGFHTAVNGVYNLVGDRRLYGCDLTYGMASVLGNNYQETSLPTAYAGLAQGDYESKASTGIIDPVWEKAYEAIANCNNIIKQAESKSNGFFDEGELEKNMIIGEMKGVRAMLHLDILRLFAPIPSLAGSDKYIPYVENFPDRQPEHKTVAQVMELIVRDLKDAKDALKYLDTEYNTGAIDSYGARMAGSVAAGSPLKSKFFTTRGARMNYFAATALLARAYLWNGEDEKAYNEAKEIYDFNVSRQWYQCTPQTTFTNYWKMPHDILFASYNKKMYDVLTDVLATSTYDINFYYKHEDVLFGGDTDDFRYLYLLLDDAYEAGRHLSLRWHISTGMVMPTEGPLAPVMRMSEVLYIICEYMIRNGSKAEAIGMLNDFRFERGAKAEISATMTDEEALDALYNDFTRESMSEGQTFFLYKRLNRPIFNGATPKDMTGLYVLPIPYSENAYM